MEQKDKIELVKNDILTRFPNCPHTVRILLWDDNTDLVECRYGDGENLYISKYYNNELTYEIIPLNQHNGMLIDENGYEYTRM